MDVSILQNQTGGLNLLGAKHFHYDGLAHHCRIQIVHGMGTAGPRPDKDK
jgi:hypothetical protein